MLVENALIFVGFTCKLPRRPFRKSRMVLALVSIVHSLS